MGVLPLNFRRKAMSKGNTTMAYYKAETVRNAAEGNWLYILGALAPSLEPALRKVGKHVPCPVHGGKDGFRLFKDVSNRGAGICNSCGAKKDGFELLMWLHGWDFKQTLEVVGDHIGAEKTLTFKEKQEEKQKAKNSSHASVGYASVKSLTNPTQNAPQEQKGTGAVSLEEESGRNVPQEQKTPTPNPEWLVKIKEKLDKQQALDKENNARLVKRIPEVWDEAITLDSSDASPAHLYLASRGLAVRSTTLKATGLRFHPNLSYYDTDGNKVGVFPAIIAAIRGVDGKIVTLHRTYLDKDGNKADVDSVKKMMSVPMEQTVMGCSIQIGSAGETLGIAEGIETALSVTRATGMPCWSAVNATLLEAFVPPSNVKTIVIWADKDKSETGLNSANKLKESLEEKGVKVIVAMPALPIPKKAKSVDWNDVLLQQKVLGFPKLNLHGV